MRLCNVRRSKLSEEYGFNVHSEKRKGLFIGAVDAHSLAERGGLRYGDRIITINGDVIEHDKHREVWKTLHCTLSLHLQVVARILSDPMQFTMLVTNECGYQWFRKHKISMNNDLPNTTHINSTPPRDVPISNTPLRSTESASRNSSHSHNDAAAHDIVEVQEEGEIVAEMDYSNNEHTPLLQDKH